MADTKVTNETSLGTLTGGEELYAVRNGVTDGKTTAFGIAATIFTDTGGADPNIALAPWVDDGHLAVSGARSHSPAGDGYTTRKPSFGAHDGAAATYNIVFARQPTDGEVLEFGPKVYTFQDVLTAGDGHIQIGATLQDTIINLAMAFPLSGVADVNYSAATTANPYTQNMPSTLSDALYGLFYWGAAFNSVTFAASTGLITTATNDGAGLDAAVFIHAGLFRSIYGWIQQIVGQLVTIGGSGQSVMFVGLDRFGSLVTYRGTSAILPYNCDLGRVFFNNLGQITSIDEQRTMLTASPPLIRSALIAGGAVGNLPLRPGHTEVAGGFSVLRSVIQHVGAGIAVTDVVDITLQCSIDVDDNLTVAIDTTGSKLHVIWEINARYD